jgi:glucose-1-phosphate cytidylyltransferase
MNLAEEGELMVFKHLDFWQPMDTLRDKNLFKQTWVICKALGKLGKYESS